MHKALGQLIPNPSNEHDSTKRHFPAEITILSEERTDFSAAATFMALLSCDGMGW
ncbi:MAG: hypothetical protein O7D30_07280 [Rickettsia endosymbiont of Ixodes persulcatus]|nr:hypothetical protein [Rickettsia endosymbiont of Ixodes persulcatus]